MTEEEIREVARAAGLDPEKLEIFEPYYCKFLEAQRYRLRYTFEGDGLNYSFILTKDQVEVSLIWCIEYYVYTTMSEIKRFVDERRRCGDDGRAM